MTRSIETAAPGIANGDETKVVPTEQAEGAVVADHIPDAGKMVSDEGCRTRGCVTWLSSGEDEGPDCGLALGLGDGKSLFIGELSDQIIRDSGVEPKDFDGIGWWVAIEDGDHLQVVAAVADQDAARALHDAVAGSLAATPASVSPGTSAASAPNLDAGVVGDLVERPSLRGPASLHRPQLSR